MAHTKVLTWFGPFEGTGAYPTINRHLCAALERRGWRVLRNQHNEGGTVTPIAVVHIYPPRAINLRHDLNVALTAWEFAGKYALPAAFIQPLQSYDVLCAPTAWTARSIGACVERDVQVIPWGIDPAEFTPQGEVYPLEPAKHTVNVLWAGGTDKRHGFDLAVVMLDFLPGRFRLIAKQSIHYPADTIDHPRVTIIREDLPSMAPLYRACDLFAHTARAVGFGLHVLEAIACGLPVASTDLSAVHDFDNGRVTYADGGEWQYFEHHINSDCLPKWFEVEPIALAAAVRQAAQVTRWTTHPPGFVERWSWDAQAARLEHVIEGAQVRA